MLGIEIQKAQSGLPVNDVVELIGKLLAQDRERAENLQKAIAEAEKQLETINCNIGKIEMRETAQKELDEAKEKLKHEEEQNKTLKAVFEAEKEKIPEQENLVKEKASVEAEFSRYDSLEKLEAEIKFLMKEVEARKEDVRLKEKTSNDDAEILKLLKEELNSLSNAGEAKEKLAGEKEKAEERQSKIEELSKNLEAYSQKYGELETLQMEYKLSLIHI